MSIQITPSGIAQTGMIICAVAGVALVIDSIMFMNDVKPLTGHMGLNVYLDDRVRAVALIAIGVLAFMFGLGIWTVGVGAIAIATLAYTAYGTFWGSQGWKGTTQTQTAIVQTIQHQQQTSSATRYRCPLDKKMQEWCREDHDGDGIANQFDEYFNNKGQGRTNCANKSYVTNSKLSNRCKVIK